MSYNPNLTLLNLYTDEPRYQSQHHWIRIITTYHSDRTSQDLFSC